MPLTFTEPKFVVRNISGNTLVILGVISLVPLEEVDLFALTDIVSKPTILNELRPPLGKLYIEINVRKTLQIIDLQFFSLSDSGLSEKGDLLTHDGSASIRFDIGDDGYVLTADSSTSSGLSWTEVSGLGSADMEIGGSVISGSVGSILFVGTGPTLAQDNANLFWDNTNNRFAVGTNTPQYTVHVSSNDSGAESTAHIAIDHYNDTSSSTYGSSIYFRRARGTYEVPLSLNDSNELIGALNFDGYDGSEWLRPISISGFHGSDTPSTGNIDGMLKIDVGVSSGLSRQVLEFARAGADLQTTINGGAYTHTHTLTVMGNGNSSSLVMNDGGSNSSRFGFNKIPETDGYGVHYIDIRSSASLDNGAIIAIENSYDGTSSSSGVLAFGPNTSFSGFALFAPLHSSGLLAGKMVIDTNADNGILLRLDSASNKSVDFSYDNANISHRIGDSTVVFNDNSADTDLRVEGVSSENLLLVDAALDMVGINRVAGTHDATLDVDNLAAAVNPFIIRDNGTEIFSVLDGGGMQLAEQGAPSTPTAGYGKVYAKTDGKLYFLNDAGTEYDLTSSGDGYGDGYLTGDGYAGAVTFWTSTSTLSSNQNNFYWDNVNHRLGIGTPIPEYQVHARIEENSVGALIGATNSSNGNFASALISATNDDGYSVTLGMHSSGHSGTTASGLALANLATIDSIDARMAIMTEELYVSTTYTKLAIAKENGGWTFNPDGYSFADFTVAGDTATNLLHVDASADRIGVNRTSGNIDATLDIDNLSTSIPPLIVRDNGTEIFSILDGGAAQLLAQSEPSTPSSGYGKVYVKTDGKIYFKNDGGTEYDLTDDGYGDGYLSGDGYAGAVTFWISDNELSADANNLFWNNADNMLGIGTAEPQAKTHIVSSTNDDAAKLRVQTLSAGSAATAVIESLNSSGAKLQLKQYSSSFSGTAPLNAGAAVIHNSGTLSSSGALELLSEMPTGINSSFGFWTQDDVTGGLAVERVRIKNTELVTNDSGLDYDFRVGGFGTRPNLLLVDAGTARVGINRAAGTHGATLDIDNLSVAESPLIIRDDGTEVFSILDGAGIQVPEQSAPGTPISGYGRLYAKTDGKIYFKNDSGTEYDLTGGGGGGGGGGLDGYHRQEVLATEDIIGTDTELADMLTYPPVTSAAVTLFLNGVFQVQGDGYDYTVSGSAITWLADTGTAVDMSVSDILAAVYMSTS